MIRKSISVCALLSGLAISSSAQAQLSGDLDGLNLDPPAVVPALVPAPADAPALELAAKPADAPPAERKRPGFSSYIFVGEAAVAPEALGPQAAEPNDTVLPGEQAAVEPVEIDVTLSPELKALNERIERTLAWYYDHPENVADRSVWGVMHALIAYGVDTQVIAGNKKVNAIGWVCYNGPCNGQRLFYVQNGQLIPRQGPGVQGHHGQFLAMLAQSRVKADFPIRVDGKDFTVADLIEFEKRTCYSKTELTFKLIALAHYLKSDETWKNDRGETWSLPKLISEELAQPIVGAACGGSHRLTGFSYAVKKRTARGEPFTGEWLRAQKFEDSYHDYTMKLQNPDHSFSTQWFAGRGDHGGDERKLETTGHITEWLVASLPKDQLTDKRVVAAVDFLNDLMWRNRTNDLKIGPKGHALHALVMYQERLFDAQPGMRNARLANQSPPQSGK
ncbi:MAG TPA: hypothetical protein VL096_20740 [Pirellulaceae bacterium]|nr:hypothetical protein [Pirellulaceae bacterium]